MKLTKILTYCFSGAIIIVVCSCTPKSKTPFHLTKIYQNKIELSLPNYLQAIDTVKDWQNGDRIGISYSYKDPLDSLVESIDIYFDDAKGVTSWANVTQIKNFAGTVSPSTQTLSMDTTLINGHSFGYIETLTPIENSSKNYDYVFFAITFINNKPYQLMARYIGNDYKKYQPDIYQTFHSLKITGL